MSIITKTDKKDILKIAPDKLYKKYTNINNFKYTNEMGDLFSCLKEYDFDYKIFNKLIFNLEDYVIRNLYRYVWIRFKLLKAHINEKLFKYHDDPSYKYINEFTLLYYKDFDNNREIFNNYHNFLYNNLYNSNRLLSLFFYNTISKYLIN